MEQLVDRGPPAPVSTLYAHVPFCRDRCVYCSFPTVLDDPARHAALVSALLAEWGRARRDLDPGPLETVYLGGGTPGLLDPALLEELLSGLLGPGGLASGAELTLEVNPANVTRAALRAWLALGITRLSIGIQTFEDLALSRLGRHHDGRGAKAALDLVCCHWEGTWSADLLVGWAGQTSQGLEEDLAGLLAFTPPHVSAYALMLEPDTSLSKRHYIGHKVGLSSSISASWLEILVEGLGHAGFERYEVSNFALPGNRSRHNQVYWRNASYLGLGPGAASSLHPLRWTNIPDTERYLAEAAAGRSLRASTERIAPLSRLLETLGVGLRTSDGVGLQELDRRFSPAWREVLPRASDLFEAGLLGVDGGRMALPGAALSRADGILRRLATALGEAFAPSSKGTACPAGG